MAQPDRRLVPIVSLDVVGYSRLVERNERQTLRLVQRVYDRLVARTNPQIEHCMEIRGVGIVDIKSVFGVGRVVG